MTAPTLHPDVAVLVRKDRKLASIVDAYGAPPPWQRPPGFATLLRIILEQQVSLASARAVYERLRSITAVQPAALLALSDQQLKQAGFSRQKIAYSRNLARAIASNQLDLAALELLDNEEVRSHLTAIKGIGPWTANIYLLMVLQRPDIWPQGDLALQIAIQRLYNLVQRPSATEAAAMAQRWQPRRSAATKLLWHFYLSAPKGR